MRLRLATKVTALAGIVLAIAMLAASFMFLRALHNAQMGELEGSARLRLEEAAKQAEDGLLTGKLAAPRDSPVMVQVMSDQNEIVAATQNVGDMHTMTDYVALGWWDPTPALKARTTIDVDGAPCLLIGRVVSTATGLQLVVAATPLKIARDAESSLRKQLAWFGPLLLLGTLGLLTLVVRGALRPIDRLRAEVDAISPTNLAARVSHPPVDDELGRLARTMNSLLERMQGASDRQIRFVSDASHELRSPLAANRTKLEVALRAPEGAAWPAVAKSVLAENGRMERMVRDLLALATSDTATSQLAMQPVDLDDVVLQEVESVRTFATVSINASQVSAARVVGNADHLRRLVANLLENAQRHAKSSVRISLSGGEVTAVLRVIDDGPGIEATDRERIFERFTRLDAARTRSDGGSGLGLAIVSEIVASHHATIAVSETPGGGATFVVELPLSH